MSKKQTVHRQIFSEIKKREKIKYREIAAKCGISEAGFNNRLSNNVSLENFWEMISACGYDLTISKAPSHREPMINVGEVNCDGCYYKNLFFDMESKVNYVREQAEENKTREIQQKGADN